MGVRRKLAGYATIAIMLWPFAIQAQTTSTVEIVMPEPVSSSTKQYVSAIVMDADTKKFCLKMTLTKFGRPLL